MKLCSLPLFAGMALATLAHSASASPCIGTGEFFVDPAGWNTGDAGSTYQAWDNFATGPAATGRTPDAGYSTNPVLGSTPTLIANMGVVTGTGSFYSFMGNSILTANIFNHGTGGGPGTHVIVQTAASLGDPAVSVVPNSLQIVDPTNTPLPGGANSSALANGGLIAAGVVGSSMGAVDFEVRIWEFFLPNHTGDFRVRWNEGIHSSFDQLRVDSFITPTALAPTAFNFQVIPEPSTLMIGFLGLAGLMAGRRRG